MNSMSQIFSNIDSKILELLECAYNDFKVLNSSFKGIAKDSRQFTGFSKSIFTSLNNICSDTNIERFKQLEDVLLSSLKPNFQIAEINKNLLQFVNHTNLLRLLFMNLNQNLLTLKFLITNLKISQSSEKEYSDGQIDDIVEFINNFRQSGNENLQIFSNISTNSRLLIETINSLNKPLTEAYNVIKSGIGIISEKSEHLKEQEQQISARTNSINESISKIITNLQYHDIVKQKIEHISQSHRTITENASKIVGNNAQEQFLSEIKELSNIQAAILVRANHEYQQAIENITEQLKSIYYDIDQISTISTNALHTQIGSIDMDPQHMLNKLYDTCTTIQNLYRTEEKTLTSITNMLDRINQTCKCVREQNKMYIQKIASIQFTSINNSLAAQIEEVLEDTQAICNKSDAICSNIGQIADSISQISRDYIQEHGQFDSGHVVRKKIINNYISIINTVEQDFTNIMEMNEANKRINKNINFNVSNSVNDICYYKVFEHKIVEITNMLNDIFREIKGNKLTPKLEKIRELYTMQSEHNIHTNIVEGTNKNLDNDNTGDVELF